MPTLLKLRTEAARSFLRDVTNENDVFHIFFGKTDPWDDDNAPPAVTDTRLTDADAHANILAVKRIGINDVAYLIPNVVWDSTALTVYDRYTDNADLSELNFYVYNDSNYCIYKCLNRQDLIDGNAGVLFPEAAVDGDYYTSGLYKWKKVDGSWNLVSTVIPSDSTGTEKFNTVDGYWWKMVYKIPDADREKFATADYLPVRFIPSSTLFDVMGHIPVVGGITITNPGSGYTTAPTVIITGDGSGAYATASVNKYGEVIDIQVIAEGHGYSFAIVDFVGGGGTGCTATANLEPDGPIPEDPNVMVASTALATAGAIEFIDIEDGGQNYSATSQFTVEGDGEGATVIVVINESGSIESIQTSNMGTGYTYANIVSSGSGENAVLRPIISPIWGHGGNVPTELLASIVGIVVDVETPFTPPTPQGDFFIGNDFRQVGVIKNIREYGLYGNVFVEDTGDSCYKISVVDISAYNIDDVIVSDTGGRFIVVEKNPYPETSVVKLLPITDSITIDSALTNETTSSVLATLIDVVSPEINKKTGDIIYLKNLSPYTRQLYQTETVKLYLQF